MSSAQHAVLQNVFQTDITPLQRLDSMVCDSGRMAGSCVVKSIAGKKSSSRHNVLVSYVIISSVSTPLFPEQPIQMKSRKISDQR